jgi:hypothetical protein
LKELLWAEASNRATGIGMGNWGHYFCVLPLLYQSTQYISLQSKSISVYHWPHDQITVLRSKDVLSRDDPVERRVASVCLSRSLRDTVAQRGK